MNVTLCIPEEVVPALEHRGGDLARQALEAWAGDAYRARTLTAFQVRQMLGLTSRWETERLLRSHGAWLHYGQEELNQDRLDLKDVLSR